MNCEAKAKGIVKKKGESTLEYYDNGGKPVYYCYCYIDSETDRLLNVCYQCKKNVIHAENDLNRMLTLESLKKDMY